MTLLLAAGRWFAPGRMRPLPHADTPSCALAAAQSVLHGAPSEGAASRGIRFLQSVGTRRSSMRVRCHRATSFMMPRALQRHTAQSVAANWYRHCDINLVLKRYYETIDKRRPMQLVKLRMTFAHDAAPLLFHDSGRARVL